MRLIGQFFTEGLNKITCVWSFAFDLPTDIKFPALPAFKAKQLVSKTVHFFGTLNILHVFKTWCWHVVTLVPH